MAALPAPTQARPEPPGAATTPGPARVRGLALAGLLTLPLLLGLLAATPGSAQEAGRLLGRVRLAGRAEHGGVRLLVDGAAAAVTGADGHFALEGLAPGKHLLRAARPGYVCAELPVMVAAGLTETLEALDLAGGDVDRNERVDLLDLVRVGADYGHRPPGDAQADLNEDGATDLLDLVMVGAAYDAACPRAWPQPSPTPRPTLAPTPTAAAGGPGGRVTVLDGAELVLAGGEVSPRAVFVRAGSEVTWRNEGPQDLDLTAEDGAWRLTVPTGGRASWSATPGIHPYHATDPASLEGVLVVPAAPEEAAGYFRGLSIADFYRDSCGGCHGPERAGGLGPALVPERLTGRDAGYLATLRDGRPGSAMPAWRALGLGDAELWGLLGYLRSPVTGGAARWEAEDIRASLTVLVEDADLPDRPRHAAPLDNLLLVTERESRSIAVLDGAAHRLVGRMESGYRTHGYAFPPDSDRWAYSVGRDGWVYKLDLYGLRAVRMVRAGLDARSLAVSDDGRFLMVGNYVPATAVILDAATLAPLKLLSTEVPGPEGRTIRSRVGMVADVAPALAGPYFLLALKEAGEVWRVDWSQPDFPVRKLGGLGADLHDGFLSPDNRRLFLAAAASDWMAVVDVPELRLVTTLPTGAIPHPGPGAVWTAGGASYAATVHSGQGRVTVWDLDSLAIVGQVETPGAGAFIRAAENSPYVWADAMMADPPHAITVLRKEPPFAPVRVITDGLLTLHPEFTADGRFVYVSDWNADLVRVYDAASLALVAEIGGIHTPTGIFSTVRRRETLGN